MYDSADFARFRAELEEARGGVPAVQVFSHGDQCGLMIIGLPKYDCDEFAGCRIAEILHEYKRLLVTGKYGRTKKQHNQLMHELWRRYLKQHPDLFTDLQRLPQRTFLRPGVCAALDEIKLAKGKPGAGQSAEFLETPKMPPMLPEGANFSIPFAYTIHPVESPNTDGSDLLIYAVWNTAIASVERLIESETKGMTDRFRVLSPEEVAYWLTVFLEALAVELQEYFKEVKSEARRLGVAPDYYGRALNPPSDENADKSEQATKRRLRSRISLSMP